MSLPASWDDRIRNLLEKRGVTDIKLLQLLTLHQVAVMRGMGVKATVVAEYCRIERMPLLEPPVSLKQQMTNVFRGPKEVPTIYFYNCGILSKDQYDMLLRYEMYTLGELAIKIRKKPEFWFAMTADWSSITRSKVGKLLSDVGL